MTKYYDVVVVGGGPAGLVTAITLNSFGWSTLVIERSSYHEIRVGEHASPPVCGLLAKLGAAALLSADFNRRSSGVVSAWRGRYLDKFDYIYSPWGCGVHLSRPLFERSLAAKARDSGVQVMTSCRPHFVSNNGEWVIDLCSGREHMQMKAAFAVDASGRSASLLRSLGNSLEKIDNTIGLVSYCKPQNIRCYEDNRLYIEPTSNGWWYTAPLANGYIATAFMTDSDLLKASSTRPCDFWSMNIQETRYTQRRIRGVSGPGYVYVRPATSQFASKVAGLNWLAIGDAAMAQDPLSGDGIFRAIRDGHFAADRIHHWLNGEDSALMSYQEEIEQAFSQYLLKRSEFYRNVSSDLKSYTFWQRRQILEKARICR